MSFIASQDSVYVPAGQLYARLLTETRPSDFGLTRSFELTPEVEEAELRNNNEDGVSSLFTKRPKQVGGTVNIELDLLTARNLMLYAYGEEIFHTQDALVDEVISEANIIAGQMTKIPAFNVSNVNIIGLTAGVDYKVDASAGVIRWLTNQSSVSGTYDVDEITSTNAKSMVRILKAKNGIEIILTMIGTSDVGQRVSVEDLRVRLTPSAAMSFINQDDDFGTLSLEGDIIRNDLVPEAPFGTVTFL